MEIVSKRLLILGGSEFQIPLITEAKKMNIYVGVVDINEHAVGKQFADEFFKCSIKDKQAVLNIAKKFHPNGITVGMVDAAVPTCAYVSRELGLPSMSLDTAIKSTDKYEMIKCFERDQVPHPLFEYISNEERETKKSSKIGYPAIVKPIDMFGSRGIYLVNDDEEFKRALNYSGDIGDSGDLLIEEYMTGREVSVELVIVEGNPHAIQVTDKYTTGAPHFAEIGHLQPAQFDSEILEEIKAVACKAARSLGLYNNLGHAEIKITPTGPKMVEIGARAGGDAIGEQLILLSTGVNFQKIAIDIAFGNKIVLPENINNNSSCIKFIQSKKGTITSISGIEEAKKVPGVIAISISGQIGKQYEDIVDNSGRIGYVISSAESANESLEICKKALDIIQIEINEDSP